MLHRLLREIASGSGVDVTLAFCTKRAAARGGIYVVRERPFACLLDPNRPCRLAVHLVDDVTGRLRELHPQVIARRATDDGLVRAQHHGDQQRGLFAVAGQRIQHQQSGSVRIARCLARDLSQGLLHDIRGAGAESGCHAAEYLEVSRDRDDRGVRVTARDELSRSGGSQDDRRREARRQRPHDLPEWLRSGGEHHDEGRLSTAESGL